MHFHWENLPESLRARLLQSGVGKLHMFEAAQEAFDLVPSAPAEQRMHLFQLARDILHSLWEYSWFEPAVSSSLLSVQERQPFLAPAQAGILKFCARQPKADPSLTERLQARYARSDEDFEHMLHNAQRRNDAPFFVLGQAYAHAMRRNRAPWLRNFLQRDTVLPDPLKIGLLADTLFADNDWSGAAAAYARAHAALPFQAWEQRRAEALYRSGRRDEAIDILLALHARRPWMVNLLLRLSDLLENRDRDLEFPVGRGAVLLYTWNKSQDIDSTLASVAASELSGPQGEARIFVLDNGSTDAVPEVLRKWEQHFAGRMSIVTLPVNVGAPAARNWLLALPEVKQADWAAFLDDDVAVPVDWLSRLWSALRAYPEAGAAACHAVDYHAPMSQQWTDMHLVPLGGQAIASVRDRFKFTAPHEQAWDFGEFDFMRPCVTGIGCCHMFTRRAMDESGPFDVRFSPSQSDDVDHDMRRGLAGHLPVYNGHLRVLHKRNTGYNNAVNRRSAASGVGNWFKLQTSYSDEELARLYALDQATMLEDVLKRVEVVAGAFKAMHNAA